MGELSKRSGGTSDKIYNKADLSINGSTVTIPDGKTWSNVKYFAAVGYSTLGYGPCGAVIRANHRIYYKNSSSSGETSFNDSATTITLGNLGAYMFGAIDEILIVL